MKAQSHESWPDMQCNHVRLTLAVAAGYCFLLSLLFVGSLYALLPLRVRMLGRDDALNIQWRIFAVSISCIISLGSYIFLFCEASKTTSKSVPVWTILGWTTRWQSITGTLVHVGVLYLGPIVASFLRVMEARIRLKRNTRNVTYMKAFRLVLMDPLVSAFVENSDERWCQLRNLLVAPFSEEIVFRGCMVPALLSTGLKPWAVTFIVPLFFGTAHAHHALTKLRDGNSIKVVAISTLFQFTYTFLFGSYAAHVFIRTGSIVAVAICHSFCNFMGLPDFGFFHEQGSQLSRLYPYRWFLTASYLAGVAAFACGIHSDVLLPGRPVLVDALNDSLRG